MKVKISFLILFFSSITLYAQDVNSLKGKTGPTIIATKGNDQYPPLYVLDGLRISQEKFAELKIDKHCIKKIKVSEDCDSTQKFNGIITVYSKLLIVLNDKSLFNSNDKIEALSKLKQDEVLSFRMLDKQEALNKYGKYGKFGALIIKTK